MPAQSTKRNLVPFNNRHGLHFALRVISRTPLGHVNGFICHFCETFRRSIIEGIVTITKRRKSTTLTFTKSFRADSNRSHLTTQHMANGEAHYASPFAICFASAVMTVVCRSTTNYRHHRRCRSSNKKRFPFLRQSIRTTQRLRMLHFRSTSQFFTSLSDTSFNTKEVVPFILS